MALKTRPAHRGTAAVPPPAFRRYTNLAAAIHLLQSRKITLLNPARWDDANDAYFMAEYKRLVGAETVLALCFAETAETYHHWRVFLTRALDWFAHLGVQVERVMTDNGSAYRSRLFAQALQQAGIRHVRTRPYTPRTNGKAERFIQTSLREWAYAKAYPTSDARNRAVGPWTDAYNLTRPHAGIAGTSPFQRLNNLLGNDT